MNRHARRSERKRQPFQKTRSLADKLFYEAVAHHQAGRLDEAEKLYRRIVAIDPKNSESLHWLGIVNYQSGRYEAAVDLIRRAIGLRSDYTLYHNSLALILSELGRFDQAACCYQRVLALKDEGAKTGRADLAPALPEGGKLGDAELARQRALSLEPDYGAVHDNLGVILRIFGRLDEASKHFEAAIGHEPRNPRYYSNLGSIRHFASDDPHLAAMQDLARDIESLPQQNQIELHFALAKAYADLSERQHAFDHLLAGNRLNRGRIVYDEAAALGLFSRIREVFTRELIEERAGHGERSGLPVFIIGMPRSGTTLVEQILASHGKAFGAGELEDFSTAFRSVIGEPRPETEFPGIVARLSEEEMGRIGSAYAARVRKLCPAAARITNKLPGNFLYAGLIHLVLPDCRIIHVRRDPLDTCFSCFSTFFVRAEFTYDLAELGRYYRAYSELMEHWRRVLPAGRICEVQYESVVANLEQEARRIVAFCGLDWDPACLDFHKTQRPVHTASSVQVRQPLYATSVGCARGYEPFLRPLLDELGEVARA